MVHLVSDSSSRSLSILALALANIIVESMTPKFKYSLIEFFCKMYVFLNIFK
jgi:hypothetical protein